MAQGGGLVDLDPDDFVEELFGALQGEKEHQGVEEEQEAKQAEQEQQGM